ncbi:hypothetical protein CY34DRAFT_814163 [Suillus luteus UH-Slu-Lm8-n1]|uniref:Uncharacterized protein n=1 Tax=Suillus luteus UH-Slu-Lm8-n1 TaxID=930992 RepID=A0A0D0A344_9AGAM|nr:hypothetical protein CY34DRAFT_814163 [Suillus luteus UH-Slu-Lm8-n1]
MRFPCVILVLHSFSTWLCRSALRSFCKVFPRPSSTIDPTFSQGCVPMLPYANPVLWPS